jgi:hypothetical protein
MILYIYILMTTMAFGMDYLLRQKLNYALNNINTDYTTPIIPSYPLVYTPSTLNINRVSPYIMTDINNPFNVVTGYYPDLDKDPAVHKTLSKYYYYKLLDKWLYNDLRSLLAYVKIDNGKARLINAMSEYDVNSVTEDTAENLDMRVNLLEKLISKDFIKSILKKIVEKYNIHWYHLNKNEDIVIKRLNSAVKEFLEDMISK